MPKLNFALTLAAHLAILLTGLSPAEARPRLSHRLIQSVDTSVREFFQQDGKTVRDIWGHQIENCSAGDGCSYYVDSLADAQIGYSFQFGLHECRTFLVGPRRDLEAQSSDCEFVGD